MKEFLVKVGIRDVRNFTPKCAIEDGVIALVRESELLKEKKKKQALKEKTVLNDK